MSDSILFSNTDNFEPPFFPENFDSSSSTTLSSSSSEDNSPVLYSISYKFNIVFLYIIIGVVIFLLAIYLFLKKFKPFSRVPQINESSA